MEPQQTIASPATLGAANGGPLEWQFKLVG
jgi:hypothetical protein